MAETGPMTRMLKAEARVVELEAELVENEGVMRVLRRQRHEAENECDRLAAYVLSLAREAGMPDSYQQTDYRTSRARQVLR